jgi:hypothetical protein
VDPPRADPPWRTVPPATWITWTMTTGAGRDIWDGAASNGTIGTTARTDGPLAAAKPAALAAAIAPVSPAAVTTPPVVKYPMRRNARSRSPGRYCLGMVSVPRRIRQGTARTSVTATATGVAWDPTTAPGEVAAAVWQPGCGSATPSRAR